MILAVLLYPLSISNVLVSVFVKGIYLGVVYLIALVVTKEHKVYFMIFKR